MIEILNWIVSDWFHALMSIVLLLIVTQFKLINIEVNSGNTHIEKAENYEEGED